MYASEDDEAIFVLFAYYNPYSVSITKVNMTLTNFQVIKFKIMLPTERDRSRER